MIVDYLKDVKKIIDLNRLDVSDKHVFLVPTNTTKPTVKYITYQLISFAFPPTHIKTNDVANGKLLRSYHAEMVIQIDTYYDYGDIANKIKSSLDDAWSVWQSDKIYLNKASIVKDLSFLQNDKNVIRKSLDLTFNVDHVDERELILINKLIATGDFSEIASRIEVTI